MMCGVCEQKEFAVHISVQAVKYVSLLLYTQLSGL